MEILKESSVLAEAKTYTINSRNKVLSCSPYITYFGLSRDSQREHAWETFGTPAIPAYFTRGIDKFRAAFYEFADLTKSSSDKSEKELSFMLESLIHARQLMREVKSEI